MERRVASGVPAPLRGLAALPGAVKCRSHGSDIVNSDVILRRIPSVALLVSLACCAELAVARAQGDRPLQVSLTPSMLYPGDVVRVEVDGAGEGERITGTALGEDIAFHFDPQPRKHQALVGIDLDTKPGAHRLSILRQDAGDPVTLTLHILPKQFPVRTTSSSRQLRRATCRRLSNRSSETAQRSQKRTRASQPGSGRRHSSCRSTESRRATSGRAAITTASNARHMQASISSASQAHRSGQRITAKSSWRLQCTSPETPS